MNTASTILSWTLAAAPASPAESFTVVDVDMESSYESTQLTAYGPDGEIAGEVFVWTDADGRVRLDATFPDGLYLSVATDGEDATIDTEDAAEVAARVDRIKAALPEGTTALPAWGACAGHTVLALMACGSLHVVACAGSTFLAGCECVEHFTDGENSCWD